MLYEIFLIVFVGFILRNFLTFFGINSEKVDSVRDRINFFVFYCIIPLICFKTTYTMPFSLSHMKVSFVATLTILSCVAISWLIYKKISAVKEIKPEVMGALIICSSFGNVLYIGLPILTKLYGEQGMSYAFTYDFLASTPLTWTVAVAVCMKYGRERSFKLKNSIFTILRIPPIWGLIAGFIFKELSIPLPDELIIVLKELSKYVTYIMLLIVGVSIKAVPTERLTLITPAIVVKLFISPALAFIFGTITGLSGVPLNVCIIDAGMPSMLLSMIFATAFGVDLRTSVEMIFLTTTVFLILFGVFSEFILEIS